MVRELGDTLVRDVRSDDAASGYGSLAETLRHQDAGSVFRSGNAVQETSHANRAQRTRGDVRDDNRDHQCPSDCSNPDHFIKGRHMTLGRVVTAIFFQCLEDKDYYYDTFKYLSEREETGQ